MPHGHPHKLPSRLDRIQNLLLLWNPFHLAEFIRYPQRVGNLHSLEKILYRLNQKPVITNDPKKILQTDAIILPGVGSFESGIKGLKKRGLSETIKDFSKRKPVLGICLGAQLLLSKGYEFGEYDGLGIIPGKVRKFSGLQKA